MKEAKQAAAAAAADGSANSGTVGKAGAAADDEDGDPDAEANDLDDGEQHEVTVERGHEHRGNHEEETDEKEAATPEETAEKK